MKKYPVAMMVFYLLGCLIIAQPMRAEGRSSAPDISASSEMARIRDRYVASVLPRNPSEIEHLEALSTKYAETLGPDGSWPDIDYQSTVESQWATAEHLKRALVMAKSARLYRHAGHADPVLDAKLRGAVKAWTSHDYRNPNWWWNEIGVPELVGEISTLMGPQLAGPELAKVVEIMKRSNWAADPTDPWTGANLIWGVTIEIVRGCLENDPDTVAEGYNRMYQEVKVVSPTEEGIQVDDSFHQHGAQLYNGGYGLVYANDVGRFISFAWGTRFQIPPDRMAIFSSYLLDGEQWLIRGDVIDYSTVGREITRQGKVAAPRDWSVGPISPAGPAYSLENVVALLAADPAPRQREFQALAQRLQVQANASEFTGNKQFWCSDFMVHRRKGFYTSVKMLSQRMQNGELVTGEGKTSQHLSDGVNLLYLTGNEYKDIFPVWDWTKLPGSTAIQNTLETGEKEPIETRGRTTFVGGVSDGADGMAAMDLARGKLMAKKAWFFFDDSYLCLGAGITLFDDSEHDVATDVNQPLLVGDVFTSHSPNPLPEGSYAYKADRAAWVYHDHVGYIFSPDTKFSLSIGPQRGRWSDIGTGSKQLVTRPVFDLWIDHGRSLCNGAYQYMVLPDVSRDEVAVRAEHPVIHVLSNTESVQAVYHENLQLVEAAFRQPASLMTPIGRIEVDHSCLLLVRKAAHGWRITASNPENEPLALGVKVEGREVRIELPGGNLAGSSVTVSLSQ